MTAPYLRLQPETADDDAFLLRLYASTREPELKQVPWTEEAKAAFVASQFQLQRIHYRKAYAQASFDVVRCDEEPVGRLYVSRSGPEILVVDLAILPECHGRGFATALLSTIFQEADTAGRPVTAHVEVSNPARPLFVRLGFEEAETDGLYVPLVRPPRQSPPAWRHSS